MVTQEGNNVSVAAVKGNFDDAQSGVKKIFTDTDYKNLLDRNQFKLSSANSINWGRLVPQIVYYFSSYAELVKNNEIEIGDKINVVVPTGNFGNILAAYYAKKMGLPIAKFICASNENNVLTDFIKTGVYNKNRDFHTTISPSMDILISSNLERFLYDLTGCDDKLVSEWMKELNTNGSYEVSADVKAKMQEMFTAGCCDVQKQWLQLKSVRLNMIMLLILIQPLQSLFTISMLLKQATQQRQLLHQLQVRSSLIRVFLLRLRITMQLSVKTNLLY